MQNLPTLADFSIYVSSICGANNLDRLIGGSVDRPRDDEERYFSTVNLPLFSSRCVRNNVLPYAVGSGICIIDMLSFLQTARLQYSAPNPQPADSAFVFVVMQADGMAIAPSLSSRYGKIFGLMQQLAE